jgi:hypothetical protein
VHNFNLATQFTEWRRQAFDSIWNNKNINKIMIIYRQQDCQNRPLIVGGQIRLSKVRLGLLLLLLFYSPVLFIWSLSAKEQKRKKIKESSKIISKKRM